MQSPRFWRIRRQLYSLAGEVCHQCGARFFPLRGVCPECQAPAKVMLAEREPDHGYSILYRLPSFNEHVYNL